MSNWNTARNLEYGDERTRPAVDLAHGTERMQWDGAN